jgi:hypothetical protein
VDFETNNNLYTQLSSKVEINLYRFDGLDIPFNPSWNKIGINLSGGADSTCLAMLLCKLISENKSNCEVHVITHNRCWNIRPWQSKISLEVFNKLTEKFPGIKFQRHVNYIPPELEWGAIGPIIKDDTNRERSGDQIIVASFNNYVIYTEKLNAVYNATSRNPDIDIPGKMNNREKDPKDGNIKDLIFSSHGGMVILPFVFVRKDWILSQYINNEMTDLYKVTRSCEGSIADNNIKNVVSNLENYTSEMNIPICEECFWCRERKWAEEKINYEE